MRRLSIHDAVARASQHLNARAAQLMSFILVAILAKRRNQTQICAGESARSSSRADFRAFRTTRF